MAKKRRRTDKQDAKTELWPLSFFACPNSDCADFNRFGVRRRRIRDWTGKDKDIRRLYCRTCKTSFSERKGSLLEGTKVSVETVVRIVKCLSWGCSVEAAADICEVDPRTVERIVKIAGPRAEAFHNLKARDLDVEVVEFDELHARCSERGEKKGALGKMLRRVRSKFLGLDRRKKPGGT